MKRTAPAISPPVQVSLPDVHRKATIYVTKYWSTKGILQIEAYVKDDTGVAHYRLPDVQGFISESCYVKPDWHESLEEAQARVTKLAGLKVKTLKKALAQMEKAAGDSTTVPVTVEPTQPIARFE